jgi:hypothetical protein
MRRITLALGCAALLATPGIATTPESKAIPVSLAESPSTPGLSTGEGKEEAKQPAQASISRMSNGNFISKEIYFEMFSPMALVVKLRDNTEKILTVKDSSIALRLRDILCQDDVFYEQAHMNTWPALTSKSWIGLAYEDEVASIYREELHPELVKRVLEQTSTRAGAIVIELGAGTGNLTRDIFNRLSLAGKEAYVFGTELMPENVALATEAAKDCVQTPTRIVEFHRCNSMEMLDTFGPSHAEKLNAIKKQYKERHGRDIPLVVVSSGGLNRLVLNGVFESSRVMQNLFHFSPDLMIATGLTDTLLTQHIIKRTGFATIGCQVIDKKSDTFSYSMSSKTSAGLLKYHETKLQADPVRLDLSLSPDPLAVLRGLRPEQLARVKFLDVSHAYFRGEAEAGSFLELAMASCPALESLLHQFGLPGDGIQMANAMTSLLAKAPDAGFLGKITSESMTQEQNIAFSRGFIKRLTGS